MTTPASYYFWKWADNDLPGHPAEVHAALLRGEFPAALQPFDARPLVEKLEATSDDGRTRDEEWDWQITGSPETAQFAFVTCPRINSSEAMARRFSDRFAWLGLSGFDESSGHVIPCLPPKRNCFISGQHPDERSYDIEAAELPFLIRRIDPHDGDPFAVLEDSRGYFVQCYAEGRRFIVEWAQNRYFPSGKNEFDQWRAQDARRLADLGGVNEGKLPKSKDPDLIRYADTLRIFETFLRREPRPGKYAWRNVNHLVPE